jgi:hypothetical protein
MAVLLIVVVVIAVLVVVALWLSLRIVKQRYRVQQRGWHNGTSLTRFLRLSGRLRATTPAIGH